MKIIIQRVNKGKVSVDDNVVGQIGKGLFVLVGFRSSDTKDNVNFIADKLLKLRVMSDENDKMNLNLKDAGGSLLVVSQFTLYADTSKGNRPSFIKAADPSKAKELYNYFIKRLQESDIKVQTGEFGAYMKIDVEADGPVTIELEN